MNCNTKLAALNSTLVSLVAALQQLNTVNETLNIFINGSNSLTANAAVAAHRQQRQVAVVTVETTVTVTTTVTLYQTQLQSQGRNKKCWNIFLSLLELIWTLI
jgi:uncharacterized membrane protein YgcG